MTLLGRSPRLLVVAILQVAIATGYSEVLPIDDFEGSSNTTWASQAGSEIDTMSPESGKDSHTGLKWTFRPDGVNRYGNEIVAAFAPVDASQFKALRFDFKIHGPNAGRIGCQLYSSSENKAFDLGDINQLVGEDEWSEVVLALPAGITTPIDGMRLFYDGIAYNDSAGLICQADNFRLDSDDSVAPPIAPPLDNPGVAFSSLSSDQQARFRQASAPKPLAERVNPYSTPMYYPMWGGSSPDGTQRSDLQEALIREFAELGMSKIHFYAFPDGVGATNPEGIKYSVSPANKLGIEELVRICKQYGVKIGLRVDLPYVRVPERDRPGLDPAVSYWLANPRNPDNQLAQYAGWVKEMVTLLQGNLEYIVIGDEVSDHDKEREEAWTKEDQLAVLKECSEAIREVDRDVLVSGFAASSGKIDDVITLVQMGYGDFANAVAINHYDYTVAPEFLRKLREAGGKDFPLLSNGVGYISSDTPLRNPPQDPYSRYNDEDQASMIARTMYSWWDNGAQAAPYYVCLRTIDYKGEVQVMWYGFFGFMDFIVDENEKASFKRYPGWYAYRTVANIFDDRPSFKNAAFKVTASKPEKLYLKAFEREGKDLTLMIWREDRRQTPVDITIESGSYKYPVQIDLMDQDKLTDVAYEAPGGQMTLKNVPTGFRPTIIRLFHE